MVNLTIGHLAEGNANILEHSKRPPMTFIALKYSLDQPLISADPPTLTCDGSDVVVGSGLGVANNGSVMLLV